MSLLVPLDFGKLIILCKLFLRGHLFVFSFVTDTHIGNPILNALLIRLIFSCEATADNRLVNDRLLLMKLRRRCNESGLYLRL